VQGLNHRTRKILYAVVAEYIATGDPVGSRTLARKYVQGLSPASIRNELADLEEAGFLHQPHTSAGRVPTERALHAFIDALTEFEEIPASQQRQMRSRVREIYQRSGEGGEDWLRATGKFLSELSGAAAVVGGPSADTRKLTHLRFIRTHADRLLAVLVFADGMVENRYVRIDAPPTERELERVHNLLADVVEGRTLAALRDLFERRLADERVNVDELRRKAFALGQSALGDRPAGGTEGLVIEGGARLMELPEYGDVERLKRLIAALGEREQLVELLARTMSAGVVSVYIGSDAGELGSADLSLVVAPYGDGERRVGTVGVLGPTRMDYARMMPLVDATAAAMTAAIKRDDRD
jgi:heat-inducible transcriptional repressor